MRKSGQEQSCQSHVHARRSTKISISEKSVKIAERTMSQCLIFFLSLFTCDIFDGKVLGIQQKCLVIGAKSSLSPRIPQLNLTNEPVQMQCKTKVHLALAGKQRQQQKMATWDESTIVSLRGKEKPRLDRSRWRKPESCNRIVNPFCWWKTEPHRLRWLYHIQVSIHFHLFCFWIRERHSILAELEARLTLSSVFSLCFFVENTSVYFKQNEAT